MNIVDLIGLNRKIFKLFDDTDAWLDSGFIMGNLDILHFVFVELFYDQVKRIEIEPEIIHHSYLMVSLFEKFLFIIVLTVWIFYAVEFSFERAKIFFHVF